MIDYGLVNWEAWKGVGRFEVGCRIESDHQPIIVEFGRWDRREEENLGKIDGAGLVRRGYKGVL